MNGVRGTNDNGMSAAEPESSSRGHPAQGLSAGLAL